ncbi:MAG: discoidin domain-containing protein [Pseudomonadota bacterium]
MNENKFSDLVQTNTNNIQLINMNQSRIHRLPVQNIAGGFVDTFTDQSGVDLTMTASSYNDFESCYTPVSGTSGLTETIQINTTADIELSDPSGLSITDQGLSLTKTVVADGSLNQWTDYITSPMSSNSSPVPLIVSASSEHSSPDCPAWRVFDQNETHSTDPQECWIASSPASETNPQWLQIDFGVGTGVVINKYRLVSRNSSDPAYVSAPRDFELSGSNDSANWVGLDSRADLPELPSNTWSDYLTFINGSGYRYYKLTITRSWGAGLTSLSQLKLVEASHDVSATVEVASLSGIVTSEWSAITNMSPSLSAPGSIKLFYALSFNKNDDSENWKIWNGSDWKNITRLNLENWQYLDANGTWIDANLNSRLTALNQALEIDTNQMSSEVLAAIDESWAEVFVKGELAIASGILAGQNQDVPVLRGFSITYDINGVDLELTSLPHEVSFGINRVDGSLLVKNMNNRVKLYINLGDAPSEWIELSGLTRTVSLPHEVDLYSACATDLKAASGPVRVRVTAPAGFDAEIHGWALNWGN